MPHFGNNFALEAQQVIYAGGAISSGIKQAELSKSLAELDLRKNVQEIRFLLVGHYLNLYKLDNQILVLQKNMELTDQVIANMMARREQGTVLKNDITRYELQKEQLNLQLTRVMNDRRIANHQLVTTLHLPDSTEILPDTALLGEQISSLSEYDWQEIATANNIALKQAQTTVRLKEEMVKKERSEILPHISLVAADHLDGPITIEVPVLNNNFNYWYVGIGIKYNISSLFKNNHRMLDWPMLAGVVSGCLFAYWWMHVRRFPYVRLLIVGLIGVMGYLLGFYFTISSEISLSQLYLPILCRGFAYAVLSATFMTCLEEIMTFQHFFQALSVFNMLHMVVGGVVGAAIYTRGMAYCLPDNMARYGAAIDSVAVSRMPADMPGYMNTFITQMTEISIKQMYGYAVYACVLLFILFLLYDAPIRRELKQMPSWQKVRNQVVASLTSKRWK